MNAAAHGTLVLADKHLRECEPEAILEAPIWWKRHMARSCHFIANKLEVHSFTEAGAEAAVMKKAAARQRIAAATIEKIIKATSNDE
jgi:hypothetical protein